MTSRPFDGLDGGCQCGLACAVRDDPQFGRLHAGVGVPVDGLPHDFDGDAVLREELGDPGQHAGLVGDVEADVVAGDGCVDGQRGHVPGGRFGRARAAQDNAAGRGDEVAQHGGRRRGAAGALAVEHQFAGVLGFDEDGVEGAADGGQRVFARASRVGCTRTETPDRRLVRAAFSAIASSLMTKPGVLRARRCPPARDGADALAVDVLQGEPGVEGQRGEDGGLGGSVVAFDVGGRVGFRVAQALGLGQRVGELRRPWSPSGPG